MKGLIPRGASSLHGIERQDTGGRDADIHGQRIRPLDRLLHEKRMPVLLVGSGISGRYMDTCTWDALLEKAAAVMGIDRFWLNGIKAGLETEHPGANVYPLLASELSKRMNGMIGRGELTRDSFPGMTDGEWSLMETCNPFKAVVCSIVRGGKLTDDPDKLAELESFRKVAGKVPAVITTNHDCFLETEVFDGFDTLVYLDDFYFSGSEGYGEILKIHGTADAPDSIVLTSEDYARLRRESKVILSRLTYLICYHPVIFIGHSLRDEEVHRVRTGQDTPQHVQTRTQEDELRCDDVPAADGRGHIPQHDLLYRSVQAEKRARDQRRPSREGHEGRR